MKEQVIDLAKEGKLLPPKPGVCQECAVDHSPEEPHNQQSLCYQYHFYQRHERWPTWLDAMAHCAPETQEHWKRELVRLGITLNE